MRFTEMCKQLLRHMSSLSHNTHEQGRKGKRGRVAKTGCPAEKGQADKTVSPTDHTDQDRLAS